MSFEFINESIRWWVNDKNGKPLFGGSFPKTRIPDIQELTEEKIKDEIRKYVYKNSSDPIAI